jgi:hypothetical protein
MGAPLLLGNLADRIGINAAQIVIVLFLVLAFVACWVGNVLQHRASREVSH